MPFGENGNAELGNELVELPRRFTCNHSHVTDVGLHTVVDKCGTLNMIDMDRSVFMTQIPEDIISAAPGMFEKALMGELNHDYTTIGPLHHEDRGFYLVVEKGDRNALVFSYSEGESS